MTGRRPKCTRKIMAEFKPELERGMFIVHACAKLGIGESTFHRWTHQGIEDEEAGKRSIYREFWESCARARAVAINRAVQLILRAGTPLPARFDDKGNMTQKEQPGEWKANAWWAEKADPKHFGPTTRIEHSNADDEPFRFAQMQIPARRGATSGNGAGPEDAEAEALPIPTRLGGGNGSE